MARVQQSLDLTSNENNTGPPYKVVDDLNEDISDIIVNNNSRPLGLISSEDPH